MAVLSQKVLKRSRRGSQKQTIPGRRCLITFLFPFRREIVIYDRLSLRLAGGSAKRVLRHYETLHVAGGTPTRGVVIRGRILYKWSSPESLRHFPPAHRAHQVC